MHALKLPCAQEFYPIGFAARIVSNSPLALLAAEESWGCFQPQFAYPPVEFRVLVTEEDCATHPGKAMYWGQNHLMTVTADAMNSGACDLERGFGFCVVTPATVADRGYFRYYFLEGLVLAALEHLYLTSLHAACVALDNRGVLLCGSSSSGKTCLAYACARAGWTYVSDDASRLVRRRADRTILGFFHQIRFRPEAARLFPELEGLPQFISESGKPSVEVKTSGFRGIVTAPSCCAQHVVFLDRRDRGPAEFRRIPEEQALRRILSERAVSAPGIEQEQTASLRSLLALPSYVLRYSDLAAAVNELQCLLEGVAV